MVRQAESLPPVFAPRQADAKRGTFAKAAVEADGAAEGLGEVLDDGEPQAGAAEFAGAGFVDAIKPLEDAGLVLLGDADAGVLHFQGDEAVVGRGPNRDAAPFAACT